jgi:2-polyprenyl-3-methyl-5-hydroxy-6-metoxy-1,4-benzoquinol methylase
MCTTEDHFEVFFSPPLHVQRKMFISEILKQEQEKFPDLSYILDVGCGKGELLKWLRMDGYPRLDGIDKCRETLEKTEKLVRPLILHHFSKKCHPQLSILY